MAYVTWLNDKRPRAIYGHVTRLTDGVPPSPSGTPLPTLIITGSLLQCSHDWRQRAGRPRNRWLDQVRVDIDMWRYDVVARSWDCMEWRNGARRLRYHDDVRCAVLSVDLSCTIFVLFDQRKWHHSIASFFIVTTGISVYLWLQRCKILIDRKIAIFFLPLIQNKPTRENSVRVFNCFFFNRARFMAYQVV